MKVAFLGAIYQYPDFVAWIPEMRCVAKEMPIHSANEMKHEAHGTQQPRPIDKIGEAASTAH